MAQFRAEAGCERDEPRADVRARAEQQHAEREADAYRAEPAQVRAWAGHDADAKMARAGNIPAVGAPTRGEAATGRFALSLCFNLWVFVLRRLEAYARTFLWSGLAA